MFGLFKKKSKTHQLEKTYQKLMKESFELSKSNRIAADKKYAEAQEILNQIETIQKEEGES